MKKTVFVLLVFGVLTAAGFASEKGNFSGTWKLDAAKSEGLPPGMDQVMTVTQTDDKITLQTKVTTAEGEQTVDDNYILNGQTVDFTPRGGQGANGKGKRTAKWTVEGRGIEVKEEAEFETPEGAAKVQINRKWQLADDNKTLTIELNFSGPQGSGTSKRTFVKKA